MAAHRLAELLGDGLPQLDGQVADAAPGVHHIGLDQRPGGTRFEAQRAGAAAVGWRRVRFELQVRHQHAQEEKGAQLLVEQAGVFGLPAQPGVLPVHPFQHRPRVHVELGLEAVTGFLGDGRPQGFEFFFHHAVVVLAPGVAGNPAALGVGRDFGGARRRGVVDERAANHGAGLGEHPADVLSPGALQVVHRAGVAALLPFGEALELRQVGCGGKPDPVEP